MTLATRALNRATLFLLALVGFAFATTAAWPVVSGGQPMPLLAPIADAIRGVGLAPQAQAWAIAAALAVIVVASLAIILTRPERHLRAALDDGRIAIDDDVVAALLQQSLADVPDVLTIAAVTYRRRPGRIVRVRVQVRPRADLALVQRRVAAAVAETDRRLGLALPLVVQLTGGLRSTFAHERRVA